ncbi:NAD(P)-binding protein [Favolaschia claudopus]|uniref:NAD(P)-binding protein n=1 Tax=Favolaschia claudopus TaxID=2862362 RepID=A0AAV9ZI15_9AGAR
MPPITNARVLFNTRPDGYPVPGETTVYDTSETIDLETDPLNGGFIVKVLVLSIDPYFRGRMKVRKSPYGLIVSVSFQIPYRLQSKTDWFDGFGVGVVLRSENAQVAVGKHVYCAVMPHQQYVVIPELGEYVRLIERHPGLPWSIYVGALGMPGQTAFCGWKAYSEAKPGEVTFVTTGAGEHLSISLVEWLVIQLAKADGTKVIASAGSEEKVEFMKSIGADVAFNYKTTDTREVLEKEGPIDIFWDNVGGDILDAAIENAATFGRFIECGSISGYNTGQTPLKNFSLMVGKCLHMHGFLVWPLLPKYEEEFYATLARSSRVGSSSDFVFLPREYSEERWEGLEKVGDAILAVQNGTSKAKAVVIVAEE